MGEPGSPTPPPVRGPGPQAGRWGNRVSPSPHPVGGCGWAKPSRRGLGKPGFPRPPPGRRVWEGLCPPRNNLMFIAVLCGGAAWTANVKIGPRGVGKPRFPTPPPRRGMGKPGFPIPPPGGRVWEGEALPGTTLCSSRRCAARAAWTAAVTIARRVPPPSQPPPAGGRRRVPAPSGGGSGQGRSPCPRRRDAGGTPALPGHVHRGVVCHAHDRLT